MVNIKIYDKYYKGGGITLGAISYIILLHSDKSDQSRGSMFHKIG